MSLPFHLPFSLGALVGLFIGLFLAWNPMPGWVGVALGLAVLGLGFVGTLFQYRGLR